MFSNDYLPSFGQIQIASWRDRRSSDDSGRQGVDRQSIGSAAELGVVGFTRDGAVCYRSGDVGDEERVPTPYQ